MKLRERVPGEPIEAGQKFSWGDAGKAAWVEAVRGSYCRIAIREAPRRLVRKLLPTEMLEKVLRTQETT